MKKSDVFLEKECSNCSTNKAVLVEDYCEVDGFSFYVACPICGACTEHTYQMESAKILWNFGKRAYKGDSMTAEQIEQTVNALCK